MTSATFGINLWSPSKKWVPFSWSLRNLWVEQPIWRPPLFLKVNLGNSYHLCFFFLFLAMQKWAWKIGRRQKFHKIFLFYRTFGWFWNEWCFSFRNFRSSGSRTSNFKPSIQKNLAIFGIVCFISDVNEFGRFCWKKQPKVQILCLFNKQDKGLPSWCPPSQKQKGGTNHHHFNLNNKKHWGMSLYKKSL